MTFETPDITFPDVGLLPTQITPAALSSPPGKIATFKGQELIVKSPTKCFWLKNFIALKTPRAFDITPSGLGSDQIKAVAIDPYFTLNAIPAYLLENDGTNSLVRHVNNAATTGAGGQWTAGASFAGVYNVLRATNVNGGAMAYCPATTIPTSVSVTYPSYGSGPATMNVGQTYTLSSLGAAPGASSTCEPHFGTCVKVTVSAPSGWTTVTVPGGINARFTKCAGGNVDYIQPTAPPWGTPQSEAGGYSLFGINSGSASFSFSVTIDSIEGSGSSEVRYSSDHGATFGAALTVGTSPGSIGGFDVQRAGAVSYAAMAGKVRKATTLGGAYSDFVATTGANPVCCILPYFRRNTTTRITAVSDPDVIIALDTNDSDGAALYWVNGTTGVKTSIQPVAGMTFSHPDCATVRYGSELAVWGTVSGSQKVYTSVDGGANWTLRGTITNAGKIRCRRNDSRSATTGQIYLAENNGIDYSSQWFANALYPRTLPVSGIDSFDTVF